MHNSIYIYIYGFSSIDKPFQHLDSIKHQKLERFVRILSKLQRISNTEKICVSNQIIDAIYEH